MPRSFPCSPDRGHAERVGSDLQGRAPRFARDGVSAAFTATYLVIVGNWGSDNPVFTMRILPAGQPPDCGVRLRLVLRHAMVPFPFRDFSRFVTSTGESVRHELRQQAQFSRTLLLLRATTAHALRVTTASRCPRHIWSASRLGAAALIQSQSGLAADPPVEPSLSSQPHSAREPSCIPAQA